MAGNVKWHGQRVRAEIKGATEASIAKLAFGIEAGAKQRITDNQQIDTGFMRNSVYTVTQASGARGGTNSGAYGGQKRESAPMVPLGDADAIVGVGAVYAIYNEVRRSFLRAAFEQEIAHAGGTFKEQFRRRGF